MISVILLIAQPLTPSRFAAYGWVDGSTRVRGIALKRVSKHRLILPLVEMSTVAAIGAVCTYRITRLGTPGSFCPSLGTGACKTYTQMYELVLAAE